MKTHQADVWIKVVLTIIAPVSLASDRMSAARITVSRIATDWNP